MVLHNLPSTIIIRSPKLRSTFVCLFMHDPTCGIDILRVMLLATPIPRASANIVSHVLEEIGAGATAYGAQGVLQQRRDVSMPWQQQQLQQHSGENFATRRSPRFALHKKEPHNFAIPEFTAGIDRIPASDTGIIDAAALEQALGEAKRSSRARASHEQYSGCDYTMAFFCWGHAFHMNITLFACPVTTRHC